MLTKRPSKPRRARPFSDHPSNGPTTHLLLLLCAVLALGVGQSAFAQESLVTIDGGVLRNNPQMYEWKVTNHHTSPIVSVHFPQYTADTFTLPPGWKCEWDNRWTIGAEERTGWVRAVVNTPSDGIRPLASATFGVRLGRGGTSLPRPGTVTIRFADSTEVTVANVELPTQSSFLERNAMTVGMAAIFLIALMVHFRRQRKKAATAATTVSPESKPAQ